MAAPDYVPLAPARTVRSYSSPPWRPGSWEAARPGDLDGRQPLGERLGVPGPDQGYVLTLAQRFEGGLALAEGEHEADAVAGCSAVALKRAALFGRAPVIHDLRAAFTIWRFLGPEAPAELLALRTPMFEECHHPHHYERLRVIADAVPAELLHRPHQVILDEASADWRSCLRV